MKRLRVNDKNYALFDYTPYFDRHTRPIPRPKNTKYDLGDVVYIKHENSIGVVIGCIDNESKELRTDMDGMVWFGNLEPATMKHFEIEGVNYIDVLKADLLTKNRRENTKKIGGITHFKDNTFDYHKAKLIKKKHPLGDVYEAEDKRTGYVANGYDWWKFPIDRLEYIKEHHK